MASIFLHFESKVQFVRLGEQLYFLSIGKIVCYLKKKLQRVHFAVMWCAQQSTEWLNSSKSASFTSASQGRLCGVNTSLPSWKKNSSSRRLWQLEIPWIVYLCQTGNHNNLTRYALCFTGFWIEWAVVKDPEISSTTFTAVNPNCWWYMTSSLYGKLYRIFAW